MKDDIGNEWGRKGDVDCEWLLRRRGEMSGLEISLELE